MNLKRKVRKTFFAFDIPDTQHRPALIVKMTRSAFYIWNLKTFWKPHLPTIRSVGFNWWVCKCPNLAPLISLPFISSLFYAISSKQASSSSISYSCSCSPAASVPSASIFLAYVLSKRIMARALQLLLSLSSTFYKNQSLQQSTLTIPMLHFKNLKWKILRQPKCMSHGHKLEMRFRDISGVDNGVKKYSLHENEWKCRRGLISVIVSGYTNDKCVSLKTASQCSMTRLVFKNLANVLLATGRHTLVS